MTENLPSTTPAGWYPDPSAATMQRYWDGQKWTEHVAPRTRQSELSVFALLAIILAFTFPPLGIVFGVMGRRDIARSGGAKTGSGLALAGLIVGIVFCAFWVLYFIFFIGLFASGVANSN